jgi:hypothetical protein
VVFSPRREHARFCSAQCRVRWNRDHLTDAVAEERALEWSLAGMRDATERLALCCPDDAADAFSAVAEAVWWVTIIDARLIRQYMDIYDSILAAHLPEQQPAIEGTLAGLRFVRNQMRDAQDGFISPPVPGDRDSATVAWLWRPVPEPAVEGVAGDVHTWELTRYEAYEAWLAGRTVGEVFQRATGFLNLAATQTAVTAGEDVIGLHR